MSVAPTAGRVPLPVFFLLAFLVSWAGTIPMLWASYAGAAAVPAAVRPLQLLMLVGPGLTAVFVARREGGGAAVRALLAKLLRWRVSPVWYAAVLLGPAVLFGGALLLARVLGVSHAQVPPLSTVLPAFLQSLALYLVLNTEELAWRGYAWPRLRELFGALRASLLLGVIWALFHAPLFLLKGGHPAGYPPLLFGTMLVAFGVLFAATYEGTGGSVLMAHLLHQAMNAWGDALPVYPRATGSVLPIAIATTACVALAIVGARLLGWRWSAAAFTDRTTPSGRAGAS